jgi:acetyl esterase/lipase
MKNFLKEIAYADQSEAQKMDIYLPSGMSELCPVIIWLHPGGYTTGDKNMVEPILGRILGRGYAVVSMNYRLADEVCFPAQIFDAKAAVRWIRANAKNYNFNREKIAAWGVSAGSTFAALMGTSANVPELEDLSTGDSNESSNVSAVVSIIGPMDFLQLDSQLLQLGYEPLHDVPDSGPSILIGGRLTRFPERCQVINPATYITSDCPPFYLQHGTVDRLVPYLQSVNLAKVLTDAIGQEKVTLNLIEDVDHFDSIHNSSNNIDKALDFLDRYMKH